MNWQDVTGQSAAAVAHWQMLGQFRARHPAIGEGKQTTLTLPQGYGFVRETAGDKVMVVWAGKPYRILIMARIHHTGFFRINDYINTNITYYSLKPLPRGYLHPIVSGVIVIGFTEQAIEARL